VQSEDCPTNREEIAERYVMGTLPEDERVAFEDHYLACADCAMVLQETAAYVEAMRAAARKLRSDPDPD
jgi:anti-sigma-K factor RskA